MKRSSRWLSALCAAAAVVALVSCGGDGDDGPGLPLGAANATPDLIPPGNVVGTVTSTVNATPLANAAVTSGSSSTLSLINGRWGLTLGDAARVISRVQAAGYADNFRVFAVAGLPVNVPSPVVPSGNATAVTIATGGTATQTGTTAQIVLPANALVPPTGVVASAAVEVRVTELNPSQNINVLPGDYTALNAQNNPVPIESFGAVFVVAADAAGARYALAQGVNATVRIPAVTRAAPLAATIALMYFDDTNGRWTAQGTATLGGVAPNQYYEGIVTRLGHWTAARPQDVVTLTGCVRDPANAVVANARVILEGISYNGAAYALTAADGTFSVPLQMGQTATVTAQAGGAVSNTVAIAAQAAAFTLTPCLQTSGSVNGLSIRLTWGALPADLDSHLFAPNGAHVYYVDRGSLTAAPFAALDVDDVTGFGPEVITITRLYQGTYRYAVYNFSGTFSPGMTGSGARIEVTRAGFTTTYAPPAGEASNRWWQLFDIVVDSQCRVSVRSVNSWSAVAPTVPNTSQTPCS